MTKRTVPFIWIIPWMLATVAFAAAPTTEYLFPAGAQQGTTIQVTAGNKTDTKIAPWPAKVWIDCPGVEFTAADTPNTFNVVIDKDAPPGPHTVRIYNADGAWPPRRFVIGRHPEILEKEPNDDIKSAQVIKTLPSVVNGTLDKLGDVDFYAVDFKAADVEAEKWLVAELECRRLGSPCDAALRLVDEAGVVVAFNHDTYGLDPLIACKPPHAGRYFLEIVGFPFPPGSDIRFFGSKSTVYRLNLTTGPYARITFPACVPGDRKSLVAPLGWNFGSATPPVAPSALEIDPANLPIFADQVIFSGTGLDNVLRLPLTALATEKEKEPNDTPDHAQAVTLPAGIDARIDAPGDVDCFSFDAKAKEHYTLLLRASSLNSPVDPMMVLTDPSGTELKREVGAGQDIRLEWTAQTNGRHIVTITDIARGGGAEYVYHLEIDHAAPDYIATVDAPSYRVEIGKTAKIQVTFTKLNGHDQPLKIEAADLPDGVTASAPDVPAKGGAVTLTLTAAADAKPANQPMRVTVRPPGDDRAKPHVAAYEPGAADLTLATDTLWLTVGSGPVIAAPVKKK